MSELFDCRDPEQLLPGLRRARQAIGRGELIVMPTDTVYGIAADAFSAGAVASLLAAKGRARFQVAGSLCSLVLTVITLLAAAPYGVVVLAAARVAEAVVAGN